MEQKPTLVIQLYGGPGAGKSTKAARIFADLKESGYLCELVAEYAKDLVWQESWNVLKNQVYIFGKQHHRVWRLNGKVDAIITDSPFLLSLVYSPNYSELFHRFVVEEHRKLNTLNIFLERDHAFETEGRYHNEQQSIAIDEQVKKIFLDYDVPYVTCSTSKPGSHDALMKLIKSYIKATQMEEPENNDNEQ